MSPCFSPLIYSFALTGSLLPLTGQSTLIYSLSYILSYIDGIPLGARFLPLSYILWGGYLAAAKECSIYRTGVRRRWKKANACLYILSYYMREYLLSAHFPPLNVSPLLVCSTGSVGGAFIVG